MPVDPQYLFDPTDERRRRDLQRHPGNHGFSGSAAGMAAGTAAYPDLDGESDAECVAYRPGVEVTRWFEIFNKWVPFFFLASLGALLVFSSLHLDWLLMAVAKVLLLPLKPLLVGHQVGAASQVLQMLEAASWYIFLILGGAVAMLTAAEGLKPTHMVLTAESLMIIRHDLGGVPSLADRKSIYYKYQKMFSWDDVTAVRLNRKPGRRSHLDYEIILRIKDRNELVIRYGDIHNPFDRMKFIRALTTYLPTVCPEEITEVFLSQGERESFTELWLRELTASPKRDKLIPLSPGMTLQEGQYEIREKIGSGGQATVYLAESAKQFGGSNLVAVKEFILPVFPDPRVRMAAAERFHVEADMIASLKHPQIVRFLDLFIEDHRAYLVLEKIEGLNLKQVITAGGALDERVAIELAMQMCDILDFLHGLDPPVTHRDFTPDNLMLSEDGLLKLIDFSVAQQVVSNVTGSVVGKLEYISPEQFRGKPTPLSDIYSLGATLAFMVTGDEPEAITCSRPQGINQELAAIIARSTALEAASRYQSSAALKADLSALLASYPDNNPRIKNPRINDPGVKLLLREKQLQPRDELP
ncbi:MAG: serine/threonine-protein kinase [Candidatus Obscuribacterales bacterium]